MSETSNKPRMSRRDFLRISSVAAAGEAVRRLAPSLMDTRTTQEINEVNPVIGITGVTIPVDQNRSITASALTINTEALGIEPNSIKQIIIKSTEPERPDGVWTMDTDEIIRQISSGITDPSNVRITNGQKISPAGIIHVPILESAHKNYVQGLIDKGLQVIDVRDDLTADGPSTLRDAENNTKFYVTIEALTDQANTYEVGYRTQQP